MAKIPRKQIARVLAEQSLNSFDSQKFSDQVAAYLLNEHRTAELEPLMRDIIAYRAEHGIVEVIAVSSHSLTDKIRADIQQQVTALYPESIQIIISEEISEDVIGGVRLEFPGSQLDLSVRAQLRRLKQLTLAQTGR